MRLFLLFIFFPWFLSADTSVGNEPSATHIGIGTEQIQKISIGTNTTPIWQTTNPPAITAFSVAPSTIDLDTRATGTITFTIGVTGSPAVRSDLMITLIDVGDGRIHTVHGVGSNSNIGDFTYYEPSYSGDNCSGCSRSSPYPCCSRNWRVRFRIDPTRTPTHLVINNREFPLTERSRREWFTQRVTQYPGFFPTSSNLNFSLNVKFSDGTYTYNSATAGITTAHIVRVPDGGNIGTSFSAAAGSNISTTLPNITQPQQTTTYRLIAHNSGGASHSDTTVTVTKNPTLANCRRTNVISRVGFTTYTFGFTLTGLPRPVVTFSFSGGRTGTVPPEHYTQGANPYTWTISNWSITMPNSNAQSLTLTATNASGTATCNLSNINN